MFKTNRNVAVITVIFQHHAMSAGFLGHLHYLPTFLHRLRGGNFRGCVLAGVHGSEGNQHVPLPWGGVDDEIKIVAGAEALEVCFAQ